MDKYILYLLEKNKRIIIPDIGALILRQEEPKEIVFNNLLSFNDGILTEHVSKTESIDYSEAVKNVEKYTEQLKSTLEKQGKISIAGLGTIFRDDSGNFQFTAEDVPPPVEEKAIKDKSKKEPGKPTDESAKELKPEDVKSVDEIQPEEETSVSESETDTEEEKDILETAEKEDKKSNHKKEEPVIKEESSKLQADEEPSSFSLDESESTTEITQPEGSIDEPVNTEPARDIGEPPFVIEEKESEAETSETDRSVKHEETEQPEPEVQTTEKIPDTELKSAYPIGKKRKKSNVLVLVISIPAVLILFTVLAMLFFPDTFLSIFKKEKAEDLIEETVITEQSMIEEAQSEQTVSSTESTQSAPSDEFEQQEALESTTSKSETGRYYVVAGCFESRENAEYYIEFLKQKGYNAELFGMRKGLHAVSFYSFTNKAEALNEMVKIRKEYEPEAWVLYY